ncbi:hypothetical protein E6H36_04210 [Candidatus Bathyarchaeota archaeon]|nr:MAG: hypothetical protein E6H36_04210 [Candidatus Bathyarchaeota archaeon]TMI30787.1 MAG: hypothetical protein E6H29_07105 [Candidatus Bathyarchaeota archaeon]
MPKIIYKPYDELIIHELVRYKLEDLVNLNALGVQSGGMGKPLYWAAGLAMVTYTLPSTDAVVNDQLNGKAHWAHVAYAPMPKFESYIVLKENSVRIPVINASTNPIFNAAASWIKQQTGLRRRTPTVSTSR